MGKNIVAVAISSHRQDYLGVQLLTPRVSRITIIAGPAGRPGSLLHHSSLDISCMSVLPYYQI
jgi:hypothetical protein